MTQPRLPKILILEAQIIETDIQGTVCINYISSIPFPHLHAENPQTPSLS